MAAQPPLKPQGAIKGEEGGFKVVYLHGGQEHVVEGLASREEAELVCDALAAKELADALQGLGARRLHQKGSSLSFILRTDLASELHITSFNELAEQLTRSAAALRGTRSGPLAGDSLLHRAAHWLLQHSPVRAYPLCT
ncbi:hypothetical protein ABPG75_005993 [Micractinium tetrahymenae]